MHRKLSSLMTKEQTTLGEPTMKNLVQRKDLSKDSPKSSENDDLNALLMEKEPLSQKSSVNGIDYNKPGKRQPNFLKKYRIFIVKFCNLIGRIY